MSVQEAVRRAGTARTETGGARVGGWMLALSPLGFVAVIATMAGVFSDHRGLFVDLTRAEMDRIGAGWMISQSVVALAAAVIAVGAALIGLALARRATVGRWASWGVIVLGALGVVGIVPELLLAARQQQFATPALGEDPAWTLGAALLPFTFGAAILQLVLLCTALWLSRARRTTGLVVGVLALVTLIAVAFAADYVPPFIAALLACPIGISWLRGPRPARASLS